MSNRLDDDEEEGEGRKTNSYNGSFEHKERCLQSIRDFRWCTEVFAGCLFLTLSAIQGKFLTAASASTGVDTWKWNIWTLEREQRGAIRGLAWCKFTCLQVHNQPSLLSHAFLGVLEDSADGFVAT